MNRFVLYLSLFALVTLGPAAADTHAQGSDTRAALPQLETHEFQPSTPELQEATRSMSERDWGPAVRALNEFIQQHPDHLEARYYRAIARRERAELRTLRSKASDQWEKGISDFQYIIERDSAFRDVLYQYALFSQVQKRLTGLRNIEQNIDYQDAVRLGHAQIRHRPDRPEHLYHLFTLYRRYIHHATSDRALSWLRSQSSDYAAFFSAEVLRLDNRLQAADRALSGLIRRYEQLPVQPVLLAQARIHYALDQPSRAEQFVRQAIDSVSSPIEAAFVLEDFKYVLDEQELVTYRSLQSPEEYRRFFRELWITRDPMPARGVNVRLAEHYRRLLKAEHDYWYDGIKLWRNNPDKTGVFEFPAVYALNHEFNDKGLVFIRHGEPDDRVVTVDGEINTFRSDGGVLPKEQSYRASWVPNESWRYTYRPMDFHFVVGEGATGNNWRLVPTVTNFQMLEDREMWGGVYRQMTRAARDALSQQSPLMDASRGSTSGRQSSQSFSSLADFTDARNDMVDNSRHAVATGLTSDRHTWSTDITSIDIPHILAAFSGPDGQTTVQLHYTLPIDEIARTISGDSDTVRVEAGYTLHDVSWDPAHQDRKIHSIPVSASDRPVYRFETVVAPDSYQVAIHSRVLDANVLGGYKYGYRTPDFRGEELTASDLLVARSIEPSENTAEVTRDGLEIAVDPQQQFSAEDPLYIYFEIYRLTVGSSDRTDYTLAYTLSPMKRDRGFFGRLFGGSDRAALSLENTQAGRTTSPTEYAEIDISEIDPGTYTFTATITDNHTGTSVQRSRQIEITR